MRENEGERREITETSVAVCYYKDVPDLGRFEVRPFDIKVDVGVVHGWVNTEHAKYWGLQNTSVEEVENAYREIFKECNVYMGSFKGEPSFLLECYRAAETSLRDYYDAKAGDFGMHILVAPVERRIQGFTWNVFKVVMEFMFTDPRVERVVVEPDVRNEKIHRLNNRAGFVYERTVELPEKVAYLAFCTRERYWEATLYD